MERFRDGPIGALLDEYERAVHELKETLSRLGPEDFTRPLDEKTEDPDCRTIHWPSGMERRTVPPFWELTTRSIRAVSESVWIT